jgi:hypothetical protein
MTWLVGADGQLTGGAGSGFRHRFQNPDRMLGCRYTNGPWSVLMPLAPGSEHVAEGSGAGGEDH